MYNYKNYANGKKICCNCGKKGHVYKKCKEPITSFGVIAFKLDEGFDTILTNMWKHYKDKEDITDIYNVIENHIHFLLIRRKDTLGYVEFVRGRYNVNNINMLMRTFNIMTIDEHDKIRNNDFDYLWKDLWFLNENNELPVHDDRNKKLYKTKKELFGKEYETSKRKFQEFKKGMKNNDNTYVSLDRILNKSTCVYTEQEWGFPKGRKNIKETYNECMIREFEEETGLKKNSYDIVTIKPLEELFMGTNNLRYKHIYSVARCKPETTISLTDSLDQVIEISDIRWFRYKDAIDIIRPYNIEKKNIIRNALKKIKQYFVTTLNIE